MSRCSCWWDTWSAQHFQRRARFRRRCLALQGQQEALFLAAPPLTADSAPHPIELFWSLSGVGRWLWLALDSLPVFTGLLLVSFGGFGLIYGGVLHPSGEAGMLRSGGLLVLGISVALALVSLAEPLGVMSRHLSKHYGIATNPEGVWFYSPRGKKRFFPWQEITLFEVEAMSGSRKRYRLYGRTAIAEWLDDPPSRFDAHKRSREAFLHDHQVLLESIAAQSQLQLRTCDEHLARK